MNLFRAVACAFKPILPATVAAAENFLNLPEGSLNTFGAIDRHLSNHVVKPYSALLTRIDPKNIETMIESSKESLEQTPSPSPHPLPRQGGGAKAGSSTPPLAGEVAARSVAGEGAPSGATAPGAATISIDDFAKLDLRIGTVLQCGFVEGSDKLLCFELDAGELGKRQIFSGIRASYGEPEKLIGRKVVFIANLAPRKMRFGVSEGMILSAGGDGGPASNQLFLLDADAGALPGMSVK